MIVRMHSIELILTLTGGLAAALVFGYVTQRAGLSPIVGYLLAGVSVGPNTPGFVADTALAEQLAEVGVILLMLSMALGAFLAGLIVAQSDYSLRAASETLPLRDAFAVLFFVSVGMLLNPVALLENPTLILGTLETSVSRPNAAHRAIVIGYGPTGRTVTRLLQDNGFEPTVIDINVNTVRELRDQGIRAVYGDAPHRDTLMQAGAADAANLILTSAGLQDGREVIRNAKQLNPKIHVLARGRICVICNRSKKPAPMWQCRPKAKWAWP
jgi:hypothetical protein